MQAVPLMSTHGGGHRLCQPSLTERPDFREGSTLKEHDRCGRVVGRYRCGRLLGRGGFAKCYEVEQDGESFALKVIDRSILQKTKTLQKLHSEISIHRRMKHKNIVNFIRTFQDEWNVYILLEKCANQTLMEISKRRQRFSVAEVQHIMLQTLSAIQYMHDQCVIHRDLKLGNMMMDTDMNVKIGDFGLAAELQYDGERKRTICGTPNYIAPEIIDGAHGGHSYEVDIWSLGVILYTLLVGEPPFQTADVRATYRRIKQCRYEFPVNVDVPEHGRELIHRILQSRPDHRPTLMEIRTHMFFSSPPPPLTAPASLFSSAARRRVEYEPRRDPYLNHHLDPGIGNNMNNNNNNNNNMNEFKGLVPIHQARREVLRPISTNAAPPTWHMLKPESPPPPQAQAPAPAPAPAPRMFCENEEVIPPRPRQRPPPPPTQTRAAAAHQLDDEEKNDLTAVHDHLHRTLHEKPERELAPRAVEEAGAGPAVWVTDYVNFSAKYGLCYRLNTGHTGVHYNDSTKMVWEPISGRVEYYARVKEVVSRGGTSVVHARDERQAFPMDAFPESLTKKITLIKYFKSYLTRARGVKDGAEVVRCSPFMEQSPMLLSEPNMISDIVYVKRWLLTQEAMIFRLSNKTIQVCFLDGAEVILSSESRVVTYTDPNGRRTTMMLSTVASRSREIAARLRYTKDILCELIQNREL